MKKFFVVLCLFSHSLVCGYCDNIWIEIYLPEAVIWKDFSYGIKCMNTILSACLEESGNQGVADVFEEQLKKMAFFQNRYYEFLKLLRKNCFWRHFNDKYVAKVRMESVTMEQLKEKLRIYLQCILYWEGGEDKSVFAGYYVNTEDLWDEFLANVAKLKCKKCQKYHLEDLIKELKEECIKREFLNDEYGTWSREIFDYVHDCLPCLHHEELQREMSRFISRQQGDYWKTEWLPEVSENGILFYEFVSRFSDYENRYYFKSLNGFKDFDLKKFYQWFYQNITILCGYRMKELLEGKHVFEAIQEDMVEVPSSLKEDLCRELVDNVFLSIDSELLNLLLDLNKQGIQFVQKILQDKFNTYKNKEIADQDYNRFLRNFVGELKRGKYCDVLIEVRRFQDFRDLSQLSDEILKFLECELEKLNDIDLLQSFKDKVVKYLTQEKDRLPAMQLIVDVCRSRVRVRKNEEICEALESLIEGREFVSKIKKSERVNRQVEKRGNA